VHVCMRFGGEQASQYRLQIAVDVEALQLCVCSYGLILTVL